MTALSVDRQDAVAADWEAIGCAIRVVVTDPADLDAASCVVADELVAIDLACSRFRDDSELMRLGDGTGRPTMISPLLAEALSVALRAADLTDGDVDPTIGGAMVAVGYDRDFARIEIDGAAITVVRRPVPGWRRIVLDTDALTVTIPHGIRLDLGATAKALAADRSARRAAEAIGGRGVLVALGGDIATCGEPPAGGWSVRVQDVTGPVGLRPPGPSQLIALHSGGLATSSTAARRWVRGGVVMHHILDPRNGVPVVSPWRTVSVAAASCVDANIASTASIVRGDAAIDWLSGRGLAARLVDVDGIVRVLPGWPEPEAIAS
jgi:thiamine biosynthesis lipoprotein ApbE